MTVSMLATVFLALHVASAVFSVRIILLQRHMAGVVSEVGLTALLSNILPISICIYYLFAGNYVDYGVIVWYAAWNVMMNFILTYKLWQAYKIAKDFSDEHDAQLKERD